MLSMCHEAGSLIVISMYAPLTLKINRLDNLSKVLGGKLVIFSKAKQVLVD